ncbi:MAG: alpha/beta hydrolase, partial [Ktedonobacterales bacterium]
MTVFAGVAVSVAALGVAGFALERWADRRDARIYQQRGSLVDVGGHRLFMRVTGERGPVVVLDAGLGHTSATWSLVWPEVARFARAVVYDRAGYGWSDPGPLPRTSAVIADELHTALARAGLPGPYALVGHSFGGLNMCAFAFKYPEEVAGLVLVDALSPSIEARNPGELRYFIGVNRVKYRFLALTARSGLLRALAATGRAGPTYIRRLPSESRTAALAGMLRRTYATARDETEALRGGIAAVHAARRPLHVPVIVLAHGVP